MSFVLGRDLIVADKNPTSALHAARTVAAAVASLLIARLFELPEAYWAVLSTLIVMQSTADAALPVSVQHFAGTAVGAAVAVATSWIASSRIVIFAIDLWAIGLIGAALRVDRSAYRYAGVTLVIVMLVPRAGSGWQIAVHRFVEVSIGIAVALAVTTLWPERFTARARGSAPRSSSSATRD